MGAEDSGGVRGVPENGRYRRPQDNPDRLVERHERGCAGIIGDSGLVGGCVGGDRGVGVAVVPHRVASRDDGARRAESVAADYRGLDAEQSGCRDRACCCVCGVQDDPGDHGAGHRNVGADGRSGECGSYVDDWFGDGEQSSGAGGFVRFGADGSVRFVDRRTGRARTCHRSHANSIREQRCWRRAFRADRRCSSRCWHWLEGGGVCGRWRVWRPARVGAYGCGDCGHGVGGVRGEAEAGDRGVRGSVEGSVGDTKGHRAVADSDARRRH